MTRIRAFRSDHVVHGYVADRSVVFNLQDRQLHSLNDTAGFCWAQLADVSSPERLIALAAEHYAVPAEAIRSDVFTILESFEGAGLCAMSSASPSEQLSGDDSESHPTALTLSRRTTSSTIGPFTALTVPVLIEVDDNGLRGSLEQVFAPLFESAPCHQRADVDVLVDIVIEADGDHWLVAVNGQQSAKLRSRSGVIRFVVSVVNAKPLDYITNSVVFHAAAAEFDDGITIFPGISNAGKSTLVSQLVHRGFGYLTDEALAVEVGTANASPFPKSISMNPGSEARWESLVDLSGDVVSDSDGTYIDPRIVGAGTVSTGGSITKIIFPEYRDNATTALEKLDPFTAFNMLLKNSFAFDRVGQGAFDTIVALANDVPAFSLVHSGGPEHLALIEGLQIQTGLTQ